MKNKFQKLLKSVPFPYALEWRITEGCNLKCRYCTNYKAKKSGKTDYTRAVSKIKKLSPKHIWFGGGEPTLVEELPQVIKTLRSSLNPHIGVNTNLVKYSPVREILPYIDDLIVSLDTYNRKISLKYRGVTPVDILNKIKDLNRICSKKDYKVNISVNSVVFYESVVNEGLKELNDQLFKIDDRINQIFCPLYPSGSKGSIIDKDEIKKKFFDIVKKLRFKKRKILVDFPDFESYGDPGPIKCYRRYFRLQLIEDGDFFSPCPEAKPASPWCITPCNAACFIDDVLNCRNSAQLTGSPLKGKLSACEKEGFESFVKKYVNHNLPEDAFEVLVKKSFHEE